jgi:hypothetical protein
MARYEFTVRWAFEVDEVALRQWVLGRVSEMRTSTGDDNREDGFDVDLSNADLPTAFGLLGGDACTWFHHWRNANWPSATELDGPADRGLPWSWREVPE